MQVSAKYVLLLFGFTAWIATQLDSSVKTSEAFDHGMFISASLQYKRESRFCYNLEEH